MFLIDVQIFELPDLSKPIYVAASLGFLPPTLTADFTPRRSSSKATLTEILVAELGDSTFKSPYLIVSLLSITFCPVTNSRRFAPLPTT